VTIIRVIDMETTGMDPSSEVIELGWCDYEVETREISDPVSVLFHVGVIPPESRAVHHISLSDIPTTAQPFDAFADVFMPADTMAITFFAAHNAAFECQFLGEMEHRRVICTYKSALRIWPDAPSHTNGALRYWLEDADKISLDADKAYPTHRAGPDAYITAHILRALFEAGASGREMVAWTGAPAVLPRCPIGTPWRGMKWSDVDAGFLGWMARKEDMEPDHRWNAQRELDRRQAA
jgi:exodeoxyribonuclease X